LKVLFPGKNTQGERVFKTQKEVKSQALGGVGTPDEDEKVAYRHSIGGFCAAGTPRRWSQKGEF